MKIFFLCSFFLIKSAQAAFLIDTMTGYGTNSDSKTSTDISDLSNHIFIGASLGSKQKVYIGQNVTLFSHQLKTSTTDKVNTLELGPRLIYFLSEENVFYGTLGWNPYAKGTRSVAGTEEKISGFGLIAGFGAEFKIDRSFHIGVSVTYHSLSISESINASNVAAPVSDTYSSIMPMINFSLRFR